MTRLFPLFLQLRSSHLTALQKWANEKAPLLILPGAAKKPEYAAFVLFP